MSGVAGRYAGLTYGSTRRELTASGYLVTAGENTGGVMVTAIGGTAKFEVDLDGVTWFAPLRTNTGQAVGNSDGVPTVIPAGVAVYVTFSGDPTTFTPGRMWAQLEFL